MGRLYVEGLENPSEFPNVIRWLVGHGYTDEQIAKVVGGNALRALREVWV
jgi:membrane dipeptidase